MINVVGARQGVSLVNLKPEGRNIVRTADVDELDGCAIAARATEVHRNKGCAVTVGNRTVSATATRIGILNMRGDFLAVIGLPRLLCGCADIAVGIGIRSLKTALTVVRIEEFSTAHFLYAFLAEVREATALGVTVDTDMVGIEIEFGDGEIGIADVTHCGGINNLIIIMM